MNYPGFCRSKPAFCGTAPGVFIDKFSASSYNEVRNNNGGLESMTRGFITIATGREQYYEMAKNLVLSYRLFCDNPLPFAILCDKENEYTKAFDQVILFQPGPRVYFNKFELLRRCPFDETIFIDADCLA